jgi:hypothetical protein
VKDLCIAKLKPAREEIEVDEVDDDVTDAEDSSDDDKEIRKRGVKSVARYKAKYEPKVTVPIPAVEAMDGVGSAMGTLDSAVPVVTSCQARLSALNMHMMEVPRTPVSIGATGREQYLESSVADMTMEFGQVGKEASASTSVTDEQMERALVRLDASEAIIEQREAEEANAQRRAQGPAIIEQREAEEANAQRRVQGPANMSKARVQNKVPKVSKAASKTGSKD